MADGSWYIDEHDPDLVRWHDGAGWTDHVLWRADWEGHGEPPPHPDELVWDDERPRSRLPWIAGSAAALVLLVLGAVLVLEGDDGGSERPAVANSSGQGDPDGGGASTADRLAGLTDVTDGTAGLGGATSSGAEDDTSSGGSTGTAARRSAATTPTTRGSTVQRTEISSRTQTNTEPRTQIGPRDDTKIGNSTATTIQSAYTPPPTTAAPPSTAAPDPDGTTDGGGDGGTTDGGATDGGSTGGATD